MTQCTTVTTFSRSTRITYVSVFGSMDFLQLLAGVRLLLCQKKEFYAVNTDCGVAYSAIYGVKPCFIVCPKNGKEDSNRLCV